MRTATTLPTRRPAMQPTMRTVRTTWPGWSSRRRMTARTTSRRAASRSTWGDYELTVIDITRDADEHPADRSTTVFALRGTVTGKIDFNRDVDWFQMNISLAGTYQIDLEGQATGRGSLRDPLLRGVYDADGNYISGTRNDDGGEGDNARITRRFDLGVYYVAVGAFGNDEGTYTLTVHD